MTSVTFTVDGTTVGTDPDGTDGWSASWDSTTVVDGTYPVTATATDTADQTASDATSVTVDNTSVPLAVTAVTPNNVSLGPHILTVSGEGIKDGATMTLKNGKGHTPTVESATYVDGTLEVSLRVEAKGPSSWWDVRVTNPDGETAVLPDGLNVAR